MKKFIKVVLFYRYHLGSDTLSKYTYLNIDKIETMEPITRHKHGSHFSFNYNDGKGNNHSVSIPTEKYKTLFKSINGVHYFSEEPFETYLNSNEIEYVCDRFEILDL